MANAQYDSLFIGAGVIAMILLTNSVVLSSAAVTENSRDGNWPSFIAREIKVLVDNCMSRPNGGYCLQRKAVEFLDRALAKDSIVISDGLSLDRSKDANVTDFVPTARQQSGQFIDIVWDKLEKFFDNRVVSINLSQEGEVEGRKKKKKEFAYYAVAVATAMALLIPLSLKGIALMAGTALLVAKVALVLAGLSALKHFVHHQGSEDSHRRVHIEDLTDAHNLAYSGYAANQHLA